MTRKLLSLITAIGMLYVYLQSQLHSGDALFLVTSDNIAVNLSLLGLAGLSVYLSYQQKFKTIQSYISTAASSVLLIIIGVGGLAYASLDNYFSGVIKPFDYLVMVQIGIIFGIFALSYKHQPVSFSPRQYLQVRATRLSQSLNNLLPKPTVAQSRSQKARPA